VSKDGSHAISGGCDEKLTWWESAAVEPKPIRTIDAHKGWIRSLDASPDGTLLVGGGNDNIVRLWNINDGSLVRELTGHSRHVSNVAFHPNGDSVLSGDFIGGLKQRETATGKEIRTFDATPLHSYNGGQQVDFSGIRAVAISPDGKWLMAGGLYIPGVLETGRREGLSSLQTSRPGPRHGSSYGRVAGRHCTL